MKIENKPSLRQSMEGDCNVYALFAVNAPLIKRIKRICHAPLKWQTCSNLPLSWVYFLLHTSTVSSRCVVSSFVAVDKQGSPCSFKVADLLWLTTLCLANVGISLAAYIYNIYKMCGVLLYAIPCMLHANFVVERQSPPCSFEVADLLWLIAFCLGNVGLSVAVLLHSF